MVHFAGARQMAAIAAATLVTLVVACSAPSSRSIVGVTATASAMASAAASASSSAAATEQLFPLGSHFDSPLYGYAIELPDGWRPEAATQKWNGRYGSFGSGTLNSDRFFFQKGYTMWVAAAPTDATLEAFIAGQDAADARRHDCPADPTADRIEVAGEPALIEMKHCPTDNATVVGAVATIHGGLGYFFYFIHPAAVEASPADRATFEQLLSTVRFR